MAASQETFNQQTTTIQQLMSYDGKSLAPYTLLDCVTEYTAGEGSTAASGMDLIYKNLKDNLELTDNKLDSTGLSACSLLVYDSSTSTRSGMFKSLKFSAQSGYNANGEDGPAYLSQDGTFHTVNFIQASGAEFFDINYKSDSTATGYQIKFGLADEFSNSTDNKLSINTLGTLGLIKNASRNDDTDTSTGRILVQSNAAATGQTEVSSDANRKYSYQFVDINKLHLKYAINLYRADAADTSTGIVYQYAKGQTKYLDLPATINYNQALIVNSSGNLTWGAAGAIIKSGATDETYYIIGDKTSPTATGIAPSQLYSYSDVYMKNSKIFHKSDDRLKTFVDLLDVDLDNLATIKKGVFYWKDDVNKIENIGITAQSIEPLFPQLVTETEGHKAVEYDKLGVVALAAIDKLNQRIKELEKEIEDLKK